MKRVILVDAKNLVYRAHFGHIGLKDEEGRPTSVLYGFPSTLFDVEKKVGASDIVVVWDNGNPAARRKRQIQDRQPEIWRKAIARDLYKANRVPNPETKLALGQIPPLTKLLTICGIPQIGVEGLEADDLMGICSAALIKDPGVKQVYILSNDRDHFQLVGEKVMILYPGKGTLRILDEDAIEKETGVWPFEWAKYKALAGDASDNYKAVKGIGPKLAIQYLRAGIDPSRKRFEDLAHGPRARFAALKAHWPAIHKCFILSQIPTTSTFRFFPEPARQAIDDAVQLVVRQRERRFTEEDLDSRLADLIRFLASYGMTHLIGRKRDFFRSAQVS